MIRSAQFQTCSGPLCQCWRGACNGINWAAAELVTAVRFEFLPASWREPFAFGLRSWLACMLGRRRLSFANSIERHALRDK